MSKKYMYTGAGCWLCRFDSFEVVGAFASTPTTLMKVDVSNSNWERNKHMHQSHPQVTSCIQVPAPGHAGLKGLVHSPQH